MTALHIASSRGFAPVVAALLEYGAHVDIADYKEQTPLFVAVSRGHLNVAALLLTYGADPNAKQMNGRNDGFDFTAFNSYFK